MIRGWRGNAARERAARERVEPALRPLGRPVLWMGLESAEMVKHTINAFLATCVTFINEIASVCERVGADAGEVEAGIYPSDRLPANIMKAMSLVPAEVRSFFDLVTHQYLPGEVMRDFSHEYRAVTHAQIELLAARVSALNRCLY